MVQDSEVREKIRAVLSNVLSLDEVEDWLIQVSWTMHMDSDPNVQDLVSSIQLVLDEYDAGAFTRQELYDELASMLDRHIVSVSITVTGAHIVRPAVSTATAYLVPEHRDLVLA